MSEDLRNEVALTRVQQKVLRHLAGGGRLFAALREPEDFENDLNVFSEKCEIVVHPVGSRISDRYRIRNKTAGPLYLADPSLIGCPEGTSGYRCFTITDAGRALAAHARLNTRTGKGK